MLLKHTKSTYSIVNRCFSNTLEMIHTVYGHVLQEMEAQTVAVFSKVLKENGAST